MIFRLAYVTFDLDPFKGPFQCHVHFDCKHLTNCDGKGNVSIAIHQEVTHSFSIGIVTLDLGPF